MSTHAPDPSHPVTSGRPAAGAPWTRAGRERRERSRTPWPFYRSGYVNTFLAGTLDDGGDFALVAGVHGRHFPFYHPRSRWDDLLLVAGGQRLFAAGRRLSPLSLVLGGDGSALVAYHGLAAAPGGALLDLDLNLELRAVLHPPRHQGPGGGRLLLGLLWQPALVGGAGTLAVGGVRRRIERVSGEMERGSLRHLRFGALRFVYDYLGLTRPGAQAAARVAFRTRPLRPGLAGWPLRALLRLGRAREELTLQGDRLLPGDPLSLVPGPQEELETLVESVLDLGPARLTRQLVRVGAPERPRWGLREAFSPARRPSPR